MADTIRRMFTEIVEMFSEEMAKDEKRQHISTLIEPLVNQIILIFKEQLGHYLQIFGISFIILMVVSLVNLALLFQIRSVVNFAPNTG